MGLAAGAYRRSVLQTGSLALSGIADATLLVQFVRFSRQKERTQANQSGDVWRAAYLFPAPHGCNVSNLS